MKTHLEILLEAYIELNKIHASAGEKCHMLAYSIRFIERLIKEIQKESLKPKLTVKDLR